MKIFDRKGMIIIPTPVKDSAFIRDSVLVVKQCYCHQGHNLIGNRVKFNNLDGIMIAVRQGDQIGLVALSPVYGDKSKITLDIDLIDNALVELLCPHCKEPLPVFSSCSCGGSLISLFLNPNHDFGNCIGVCNRIGCMNAQIKNAGDLITDTFLDTL